MGHLPMGHLSTVSQDADSLWLMTSHESLGCPWSKLSPEPAERGPAVPAISRDEVAHLARLSRLALTDDELDLYAGQLDVILTHVASISEVAAADVPATASPNPATNVTRPDVVQPSLTPEQALAAAPAVEEQRFLVPQILGEGE